MHTTHPGVPTPPRPSAPAREGSGITPSKHSHPTSERPGLAGRSSGTLGCRCTLAGPAGGTQVCLLSSPCHPVCVRVVRSCSSPTAASGKGAARRWGRGAGCEHAAGTGAGAGAALASAVGPPHSPHFGRHRGHGLAPQRPPPGGDGAHGRGGGASPGLRARPAPVASVGGAAPRRRSGSGSGSDSGPAWPRRSFRAPRRTEQHCQAGGWRSAHRDVRAGAGLGGAAPVTSGLGSDRPQPRQGEEGSAHRNVRTGRGPEGTRLKPRPPRRQ